MVISLRQDKADVFSRINLIYHGHLSTLLPLNPISYGCYVMLVSFNYISPLLNTKKVTSFLTSHVEYVS
jgi:hypothetical protein